MLFLPRFKKRRICQLQGRIFAVQEYLNRRSRRNQFSGSGIKEPVMKFEFGGFAGNKICFDDQFFPKPQGTFVIALNTYNGNNISEFVKIQVTNAVFISE